MKNCYRQKKLSREVALPKGFPHNQLLDVKMIWEPCELWSFFCLSGAIDIVRPEKAFSIN